MKVSTKTAQSELNRFHFEFPHGTSGKFYEPGVAAILEVRKGSKMTLRMASLRRIDPMPLPPMSIVRFNTRFFYVPMIDICPYFNDMDARTPYAFRYGQATSQFNSEIPLKVPQVQTKDIKLLLFNDLQIEMINDGGWRVNVVTGNNNYVTAVGTDSDIPNRYDIRVRVTQSGHTGYVYFDYTQRGRNFYKLLKQCGLDFAVTNADYFDEGYKYNSAQSDTLSALPLLAFVKVYLNYYEASQYINNTQRLARLNSLLHIDKPDYKLDQIDLDLICDLTTYLVYDNDYFTSSFVNPANGNEFINNLEQIKIDDVTTVDEVFSNGVTTASSSQGTPVLKTLDEKAYISDNGLNLLKRLTNYLRRHQVAGGRMVDRILAEYGVSIENSYSRRSSYIDTISAVMNITPVINTTSEQLGDYAGFGSASNNMNNNAIQINVPDEDGFIIAIDTAIPEVMYSQGYRRLARHITKFDFVAGTDFDAIGTQAIEQGEVLMTKQGINYHNDTSPSALTFGFVPRGAEYKMQHGYLTGDFLCNSVNVDRDAYFTDRRFNEINHLDANNKINITTGRSFVSSYDSHQYERIFYSNKRHTDYINTIFRFEIDMVAPFKSIYDEYRLDDLSGNKEVKMEVGGQQLN